VTNHHIDFIPLKVRKRFSEKQSITRAERLGESDLEFGVVLIQDALCHIIARLPFCQTVTGVPQEVSCVQYNEAEIDEFYLELEQNVSGMHSSVIYNVDEGGLDSWLDATRVSAIVLVDYEDSQIAVPITRSGACATMVACIAVNGRVLK
jgi:hypothetical protein